MKQLKDYIVTFKETNDWEDVQAYSATEAHEKGMEIFDAWWEEIEVRERKPCFVDVYKG